MSTTFVPKFARPPDFERFYYFFDRNQVFGHCFSAKSIEQAQGILKSFKFQGFQRGTVQEYFQYHGYNISFKNQKFRKLQMLDGPPLRKPLSFTLSRLRDKYDRVCLSATLNYIICYFGAGQYLGYKLDDRELTQFYNEL